MTIVFPYKPDIFDGLELRYSLRSIEKNLTGFTDLIIYGNAPEWYRGNWMPSSDYPGRKQFTIYNKLLAAETDNFLMFNDDHFLLKPLQIHQIKYWHNGPIKNEFNRNLTARYADAVKNTINIIPEGLNFDIHTPIIYNKGHFRKLFLNKTEEICIKSYYCSSLKIEGEKMDDLKIDTLLSEEAIKELIKDRLFFSTGPNGIKEPMKKVLQELYPIKSRWEK
jgi:hypothetical protein